MEETNAPQTQVRKRRPRRSEAEGLALVRAFRESGLSRAKFCDRERVGIWLLNYWISRDRSAKPNDGSRFIPVKIEPTRTHNSSKIETSAVELCCGNLRCSIPSELGAEFVAKVLSSLTASKKELDDLQ